MEMASRDLSSSEQAAASVIGGLFAAKPIRQVTSTTEGKALCKKLPIKHGIPERIIVRYIQEQSNLA